MGVRRRGMASAASSRPPHSPYDNVSLTQSLDESYSIDLEFGSANTSRARYVYVCNLLLLHQKGKYYSHGQKSWNSNICTYSDFPEKWMNMLCKSS